MTDQNEFKKYDYNLLASITLDYSKISSEIISKHFSGSNITYNTHLFIDFYRRFDDVLFTISTLFGKYNTPHEFAIGIALRTLCLDSLNVLYFITQLANNNDKNNIENLSNVYNGDQLRHFIHDYKVILKPKKEYYGEDSEFKSANDKYFKELKDLYAFILNEYTPLVDSVRIIHKNSELNISESEFIRLNEYFSNKNTLESAEFIFKGFENNKSWFSAKDLLNKITSVSNINNHITIDIRTEFNNLAYHLCFYYLQYSKYEHTGLLSNNLEGIPFKHKMDMKLMTILKIIKVYHISISILEPILKTESPESNFNNFKYSTYKAKLIELENRFINYLNSLKAV